MLSQERKEEVNGNPPISHALSSQLLLWRQDSAWFRADPERREVTAHAPRGTSVTPMRPGWGRGGSYLGQSLHHGVQQGPHSRGHLQELQHCGQHPTQPTQPRPAGTGLRACARVNAVEREGGGAFTRCHTTIPWVQMNGGGAQKQVPGGWQC